MTTLPIGLQEIPNQVYGFILCFKFAEALGREDHEYRIERLTLV